MDPEQVNVSKGGETKYRFNLNRSKMGLNFSIWAHPDIEEGFRLISEGTQPLEVGVFGRSWRSTQPLLAYDTSACVIKGGANDPRFSIDYLGQPLFIPDGRGPGGLGGVVNLSFLRLIGISEGEGVKFAIKGVVFGEEQITKLQIDIAEALKVFHRTFMKPINVTLFVTSQEG